MSRNYNLVALLPMKAHSARVSGKNFRMFAGKPLFRWILETLLEMDEVDLVVINTDAEAILAEHGIRTTDRVLIRQRQQAIRGDLVSMNRIIQDDLQAINSQIYLMTHVTNPLLTSATITEALQAYQSAVQIGDADSLFTVNRIQTRFYRQDGSPVNHDPNQLLRTQDLEPWFEENSNLYIFSQRSFSATGARIGAKPLLFETPMRESLDIDDQQGWEFAELVAHGFAHCRTLAETGS